MYCEYKTLLQTYEFRLQKRMRTENTHTQNMILCAILYSISISLLLLLYYHQNHHLCNVSCRRKRKGTLLLYTIFIYSGKIKCAIIIKSHSRILCCRLNVACVQGRIEKKMKGYALKIRKKSSQWSEQKNEKWYEKRKKILLWRKSKKQETGVCNNQFLRAQKS